MEELNKIGNKETITREEALDAFQAFMNGRVDDFEREFMEKQTKEFDRMRENIKYAGVELLRILMKLPK